MAFVNKPVWDSYLAFIDEVGADAAFQAERIGEQRTVHTCRCAEPAVGSPLLLQRAASFLLWPILLQSTLATT